MSGHLLDTIVAANREGRRHGIYSVCSAHQHIDAVLRHYARACVGDA